MEYDFNEADASPFYKDLRHKPDEWTEIRVIEWKPNAEKDKSSTSIFVNNEADFLKVCREWNGIRQVYAGYNPRPNNGDTEDAQIKRLVMIPFDIDAEHPKDEAATEKEMEGAADDLEKVEEWTAERNLPTPYIDFTGNGYRIGLLCDLPVTADLKEKLYGIFDAVKRDTGANLDNILNLSRIIKVPGVWSIKGSNTTERPHRQSHILKRGDTTPEAIEKVNNFILNATPRVKTIPPPSNAPGSTGGDVILQAILAKDKKLANLFLGLDNAKYKSRSEAEAALATKLFIHRFNEADVRRLMAQARIGKWLEENDGYRDNTVKYAYGKAQEHLAEKEKKDAEKAVEAEEEAKNPKEAEAKRLGDLILSEAKVITIRDNEAVFAYRDGVYLFHGETYIKERAQQLLGRDPSTHDVNEVLGYIKRATYRDRDELSPPLNKICVSNGILDLDTMKLEDFTPSLFFTSKIPVEYRPEVTNPIIIMFLDKVAPGKRAIIEEIIGYSLYRDYFLQYFFVFEGEGANGKSTLNLLLSTFLDSRNISTVAMQDLGDRFRKANLYGRLANISDDLSARALKDTSALKELSGNAWTTAEEKFQGPFNFRNYAKLIFSCNQVPMNDGDDTEAFYRRAILIKFPNKFRTDAKQDDPERGIYRADPTIIQKLTTADELSGLLNAALAGLKRLREKMDFTGAETAEARRIQHIQLSNPIQFFAISYTYANPRYGITKSDLYQAYCNYCESIKKTPKADNVFSGEIKRYLSYVSERLIYRPDDLDHAHSKIKIWIGIAFTGGEKGQKQTPNPFNQDTMDTVDTVSLPFKTCRNLEYGVVVIGKKRLGEEKNYQDTVSIVSTVSPQPITGEKSPEKHPPDTQKVLDFMANRKTPLEAILGKFNWRIDFANSLLAEMEKKNLIKRMEDGEWIKI